jgi:Snf7
MAKRGDSQSLATCKTLAKELVRSRKAKERLYLSKTNLHSVEMQLSNQLAQLRIAKSMQQSAQVHRFCGWGLAVPGSGCGRCVGCGSDFVDISVSLCLCVSLAFFPVPSFSVSPRLSPSLSCFARFARKVMRMMNQLVSVPQISTTMMSMQREMAKAGMIEEMMGEAIDDAFDAEDEEVCLVLPVFSTFVDRSRSLCVGGRGRRD